MKSISSRSPKNIYRAEIHYFPALDFGSVESAGAMTLEAIKTLASEMVTLRKSSGYKGKDVVAIIENKASYPSFDWVKVESWTVEI